MSILVVSGRSKIGRVDLKQEPRLHNGAVLSLHHVGERGHIGVLGRVMQVNDEASQDSWRRRGHERFRWSPFVRGGFQMREIVVECGAVLVALVPNAARKRDTGG